MTPGDVVGTLVDFVFVVWYVGSIGYWVLHLDVRLIGLAGLALLPVWLWATVGRGLFRVTTPLQLLVRMTVIGVAGAVWLIVLSAAGAPVVMDRPVSPLWSALMALTLSVCTAWATWGGVRELERRRGAG